MDFRMRRIRLQFINCIDRLSGNNKKTFKLSAQVEMLTLIHGNPPANTSRKILCPSVLQDSVRGDLFCILQSCIWSDKWDLRSIKGFYSQKLPHLCWGRFIAAGSEGRAVLQWFSLHFLFTQLFTRCWLQFLSASFIAQRQIIGNHWKIINPLNQPISTETQRCEVRKEAYLERTWQGRTWIQTGFQYEISVSHSLRPLST